MEKSVQQDEHTKQEKIVWAIKISQDTKNTLQHILEESRLTVQEFLSEALNNFLAHQHHNPSFREELRQIETLIGRLRQAIIHKLSDLEEERNHLEDQKKDLEKGAQKRFAELYQQLEDLQKEYAELKEHEETSNKQNQIQIRELTEQLSSLSEHYTQKEKEWLEKYQELSEHLDSSLKTCQLYREQNRLLEDKYKELEAAKEGHEQLKTAWKELQKQHQQTVHQNEQLLQDITHYQKKIQKLKRHWTREKEQLTRYLESKYQERESHAYLRGKLEAWQEWQKNWFIKENALSLSRETSPDSDGTDPVPEFAHKIVEKEQNL